MRPIPFQLMPAGKRRTLVSNSKRRNKMKLLTKLFLISSFLLIFSHCDNGVENNVSSDVKIEKRIVADMLGNNDGITSEEEIFKVDSFYNTNEIGFAIGSGYINFGSSIPADTIKKYFHVYSPISKNETELREAFKGISIRTPVIGIFVMKSNNGISVIKLYRAPGPNIYGGTWNEIEIL